MTTHASSQHTRLSRAWPLTLASLLLSASALAAEDRAMDAASAAEPKALSRAEVIADLNLWRRAGAEQHAENARYYQIDEAAYGRALAEYRRLRHGPAFAHEVARVLGQEPASTHADAR